ncbi:hypothetical protein MG5_03963, partial [Candida albicans P57072]
KKKKLDELKVKEEEAKKKEEEAKKAEQAKKAQRKPRSVLFYFSVKFALLLICVQIFYFT